MVSDDRTPGLRERKKQRTRASLIDAAVGLSLERGYNDTTVEQIAINSKCDLFREIYGYDITLAKS